MLWKCKICTCYFARTFKELMRHIRRHSHQTNFVVTCCVEDCEKKYFLYDTYYRHVMNKHGHLMSSESENVDSGATLDGNNETDQLHDETDQLHDETDQLHDETDQLHDDTDQLHDDSETDEMVNNRDFSDDNLVSLVLTNSILDMINPIWAGGEGGGNYPLAKILNNTKFGQAEGLPKFFTE